MADVFDQISARLDIDDDSGLSPLELADLPEDQKQVVLALLRDPEAADVGLTDGALRTKLHGKVVHFDETLRLLARYQWIIVSGEVPDLRFRLNLRAKRPSSTAFNLWTTLMDRLPKDGKGTLNTNAS